MNVSLGLSRSKQIPRLVGNGRGLGLGGRGRPLRCYTSNGVNSMSLSMSIATIDMAKSETVKIARIISEFLIT